MRKLFWPALFCLAFLNGCGSYSASLSARNYVSSKTTWEYESTAVGGDAILLLPNGEKLIVPREHEFANKFLQLKKGGFIYFAQKRSFFGNESVAKYLAPDDEETRKIVKARETVGPGM